MYQAGRIEPPGPLLHIIIKASEHEHGLNHYQGINDQNIHVHVLRWISQLFIINVTICK